MTRVRVGLGLVGLLAAGVVTAAGVHQHGLGVLEVAIDGAGIEATLHSPLANLIGFEHAPRDAAEAQRVAEVREALGDGARWLRWPEGAGCRMTSAEVVLAPAGAACPYRDAEHCARHAQHHGQGAVDGGAAGDAAGHKAGSHEHAHKHQHDHRHESPAAGAYSGGAAHGHGGGAACYGGGDHSGHHDPARHHGGAGACPMAAGQPAAHGHGHEHGGGGDPGHGDAQVVWTFACAQPEALDAMSVTLFGHFPGFEQIDAALVTETGQHAARLTPDAPDLRF